MAVKIRLARGGAKKKPHYRIVVANSNAPRDGYFLEKVGTYNPMLTLDNSNRITLQHNRIEYWLSIGAQPTERVAKFIMQNSIKLPNKIQKKIDIKLKNQKIKSSKKSLKSS